MDKLYTYLRLFGLALAVLFLILFVYLSASPVYHLFVGEIINGYFKKEIVIPSADHLTFRVTTDISEYPLSGKLYLLDERGTCISEYKFNATMPKVSLDDAPNQSLTGLRTLYLTSNDKPIDFKYSEKIISKKVILLIICNKHNKIPIQVRTEWVSAPNAFDKICLYIFMNIAKMCNLKIPSP